MIGKARNGFSTKPARFGGAERGAILQALEANGFNVTRAARSLGVSRATLYRMLRRNGIELTQECRVRDAELAAGED